MTMIVLIVRGQRRLMLRAIVVVAVAAVLLGTLLRFLAGLSTPVSVVVAAVAGVLALVAFVLLCAAVLAKIMDITRTAQPLPDAPAGPEYVSTGNQPSPGAAAGVPPDGEPPDGDTETWE